MHDELLLWERRRKCKSEGSAKVVVIDLVHCRYGSRHDVMVFGRFLGASLSLSVCVCECVPLSVK